MWKISHATALTVVRDAHNRALLGVTTRHPAQTRDGIFGAADQVGGGARSASCAQMVEDGRRHSCKGPAPVVFRLLCQSARR